VAHTLDLMVPEAISKKLEPMHAIAITAKYLRPSSELQPTVR